MKLNILSKIPHHSLKLSTLPLQCVPFFTVYFLLHEVWFLKSKGWDSSHLTSKPTPWLFIKLPVNSYPVYVTELICGSDEKVNMKLPCELKLIVQIHESFFVHLHLKQHCCWVPSMSSVPFLGSPLPSLLSSFWLAPKSQNLPGYHIIHFEGRTSIL